MLVFTRIVCVAVNALLVLNLACLCMPASKPVGAVIADLIKEGYLYNNVFLAPHFCCFHSSPSQMEASCWQVSHKYYRLLPGVLASRSRSSSREKARRGS